MVSICYIQGLLTYYFFNEEESLGFSGRNESGTGRLPVVCHLPVCSEEWVALSFGSDTLGLHVCERNDP